MKLTFRSPLSAIAAGALVAGFLHFTFNTDPVTATVTAVRAAEAAARGVKLSSPLTFSERVANVYSSVVERFSPQRARSASTLLLNQPVAILHDKERLWTELPRGTAVQLVSAEGAFVRVRHARSIVTMPRSALVQGATRTN